MPRAGKDGNQEFFRQAVLLDFRRCEDKQIVRAGGDSSLDGEKRTERCRTGVRARVAVRQAGPFRLDSQLTHRNQPFSGWTLKTAAESQFDGISIVWNPIPEPDDRAGYECVTKLDFIRIKAMNAEEGYAAEQVILHRQSVVHIHEFARHEPAGDCFATHPGMR